MTASNLARHGSIAPAPVATFPSAGEEGGARSIGPLVKRGIDIGIALALLLLTFPVLLVAALAVRVSSRGPVIFCHRRVGVGGEEFMMYKLRTMRQGAQADEDRLRVACADRIFFKVSGDIRITRVGRLLRKYSIDELPQLYNVLRGEMSMVGPRPLLPSDMHRFPRDERMRRFDMKPGLTGLWQVSGRSLCSDAERIRLDLEYVDRWNLGLDLRILLRTPATVLSGRGAY